MSKLDKQVELQRQLQMCGYNVVTCGSCGTVNLHETRPIKPDQDTDIECWACGMISDPCDFPDMFYEGMTDET